MAQIIALEFSVNQSEAGEHTSNQASESMTRCRNRLDVELDISFREHTEVGLLIPPDSINPQKSGDVDPKLEVLCEYHDSGMAGHWGRHKTQELVSRNLYWEG